MADSQSNDENKEEEQVEVFASSNMASLAVAEAFLMEEGIPYFIQDAAQQRFYPGLLSIGGKSPTPRIYVNAEDEEVAKALLSTIEDHPERTTEKDVETAEDEDLESTEEPDSEVAEEEGKKKP
ncbi:MAG: DUF2007 domain-containing protein [Candidatus Sumerlaeota bacterium]|nr:DUF2007 domain-containing protein [Candidatus Sumerlaeota bacterium]